MVYENGLRSLAELTSASIELFRKMAEVSLVPQVRGNSNGPLASSFRDKYMHLEILLINTISFTQEICFHHLSISRDRKGKVSMNS